MALMKIAGRWGFRRVMGGLSVVYIGLIYLFFKVSNPIKLVEEVNKYYPYVDEYFMSLDPGFLKYLPNHWVSEFMLYMARDQLAHALPFAGILLGVTAACFVLCLLIAHRFYYKSWLITFHMQVTANSPRTYERVRRFDFRKPSRLTPELEALVKKEFFQFFREPSQWIHLAVLVILIVVFVSSLRGLRFAIRFAELQLLTYLVLFAFSAFLSSSLSLRFIFPMISLEGLPFWSVLSSPFPLRKLYTLKLLIGFGLVGVTAAFVATFMNLPFRRLTPDAIYLLWFGIFSSLSIALAMVCMNLGLGGYFANYQEKNPIRVASSQGATLTFLVSLVYLVFLVLVVILPLSRFFEAAFLRIGFDPQGLLVSSILLGVVSGIAAVVGTIVGLSSLKRDF
jgi:ABC-2 type transport system permease protein